MGHGSYILDERGNPKEVDNILEWADWFEKADRTVAKDEFNGIMVSTVFLGIDHSFGNSEKPVLYETMIFGLKEEDSEYQERYATKVEALAGHERAIRYAKKVLNDKTNS